MHVSGLLHMGYKVGGGGMLNVQLEVLEWKFCRSC